MKTHTFKTGDFFRIRKGMRGTFKAQLVSRNEDGSQTIASKTADGRAFRVSAENCTLA